MSDGAIRVVGAVVVIVLFIIIEWFRMPSDEGNKAADDWLQHGLTHGGGGGGWKEE